MAISFNTGDNSNYIPLKLKATDDIMWDNDNGIVYRKFKGYITVDTDNIPQPPTIQLSQAAGYFRPYGYCDKFFISNIQATKMTTSGSNGDYVDNFEPMPSDTIRLYLRNGIILNLVIDTAVVPGSTVYVEADFWFGYSTLEQPVDNIIGYVTNKTIYDEDYGDSYFALEPFEHEYHKYQIPGNNLVDGENVVDNTTMLRETKTPSKTSITFTSGNAQKPYDGTPLKYHQVTNNYSGNDPVILSDLSKISIDWSGSQTNVGSSSNYFYIEWNGVNEDKYNITKEYGTLTVSSPGGSDAPPAPTP